MLTALLGTVLPALALFLGQAGLVGRGSDQHCPSQRLLCGDSALATSAVYYLGDIPQENYCIPITEDTGAPSG